MWPFPKIFSNFSSDVCYKFQGYLFIQPTRKLGLKSNRRRRDQMYLGSKRGTSHSQTWRSQFHLKTGSLACSGYKPNGCIQLSGQADTKDYGSSDTAIWKDGGLSLHGASYRGIRCNIDHRDPYSCRGWIVAPLDGRVKSSRSVKGYSMHPHSPTRNCFHALHALRRSRKESVCLRVSRLADLQLLLRTCMA